CALRSAGSTVVDETVTEGRMRMLRVVSIVLAVVVSGCELVTDPNDDPRGTRLPSDDFSARLVQSGDAPLPELLIRGGDGHVAVEGRSEEHTSELQSRENLVCRLLLEKKNKHP